MPQEIRLHDLEYAKKVYSKFAKSLVKNGITHSVIMATIHADSTTVLFDELVKSSRPVMSALAEQAVHFQLPVQAHLSENPAEIAFTLGMYPDCADFLDSYERAGLMLGSGCVAAHCVHLLLREQAAIRDRGILVAHCPHSNLNLLSGMMPLADYHDRGLRVGLGSDISGGHTLSPFANIVAAIQTGAALYLCGSSRRPVTAAEAFFAATKGGGSFFGKTGSFEAGYCFDALVINDLETLEYNSFSLEQRAEKMLYCCDDRNIVGVFIDGEEVKIN